MNEIDRTISYEARPEPIREIGLTDLLWLLLRRWFVVAAFIVLSLAAAVVYLKTATYKYTAELKVTPVQEESGTLARNLGNLATIAGLNVPRGAQTVSPFMLYLESIKTQEVADALSADQTLMHSLFSTEWDPETASWKEPKRGFLAPAATIRRLVGAPVYPWHAPNASDLRTLIQREVRINEEPRSSVVTITFNNADPSTAVNLLQKMHDVADSKLRQRTLERASNYIAYLQRILPTTTIGEYRQALAQALADQEKLKMMASANNPFAAAPFGHAVASDRATTPSPLRVLGIAVLVGLLSGILLVVNLRWPSRR